MTPVQSRSTRRRLWRVFATALIVALAAGLWLSWFFLRPLVEERRPFVGTWRLESPWTLIWVWSKGIELR